MATLLYGHFLFIAKAGAFPEDLTENEKGGNGRPGDKVD
jgi:hypothetical protein